MHVDVDVVSAEEGESAAAEPCRCSELTAVTERCVLAAGRHLGRGDAAAADRAASEAMVSALEHVPVSGRLVIGRDDEGHPLAEGREIGGGGARVDLACDPVGNGAAVAGGR